MKCCFLAVVAIAALSASFLYPSIRVPSVTDVFDGPVHFTPLESDFEPRDAYSLDQLTPEDRHILIDITDFNFIIRPAPTRDCESRRPLILALIHSAPENHERRAIIRNTWLSQRYEDLVALFMLGTVSNNLTRIILEKETERYGDLVQGNFIDSYHNMTYKHVMSLKYAAYHCPGARYVVKTDDDIVMNLDYLQKLLQTMSPYGVRDLLLCRKIWTRSKVVRSYRSKWRVAFRDYPSYSYPKYCSGGAVIYSPDVVFRIYQKAQNLPFFWIDDVHVTGTAAVAAQVEPMCFLPRMNPFLLL